MNKSFSKGEGEGIEAVCRTFGEHDLIATLGIDKISNRLSRSFVLTRCYLT